MCKMTHVNADSIKIVGRETEMPLVPLVEPQKLLIVHEPLDREEWLTLEVEIAGEDHLSANWDMLGYVKVSDYHPK